MRALAVKYPKLYTAVAAAVGAALSTYLGPQAVDALKVVWAAVFGG